MALSLDFQYFFNDWVGLDLNIGAGVDVPVNSNLRYLVRVGTPELAKILITHTVTHGLANRWISGPHWWNSLSSWVGNTAGKVAGFVARLIANYLLKGSQYSMLVPVVVRLGAVYKV